MPHQYWPALHALLVTIVASQKQRDPVQFAPLAGMGPKQAQPQNVVVPVSLVDGESKEHSVTNAQEHVKLVPLVEVG
jgi:hypothetical protein